MENHPLGTINIECPERIRLVDAIQSSNTRREKRRMRGQVIIDNLKQMVVAGTNSARGTHPKAEERTDPRKQLKLLPR